MPSQAEILAALSGIPGPDGRTPLPDSGAIDGVTQRDGKVFIAIRIDPAKAGAMAPMQAPSKVMPQVPHKGMPEVPGKGWPAAQGHGTVPTKSAPQS